MREPVKWGDMLAALVALPDATPCELVVGRGPYTLGDLKAAASHDGPATLTTVQAAARFGFSEGYWRDVAKGATDRGAFKDRMWRIPVAVCEEHVRTKRAGRARKPRRPWNAEGRE